MNSLLCWPRSAALRTALVRDVKMRAANRKVKCTAFLGMIVEQITTVVDDI